MPAWNVVTANGANMQVSGCDFMTIHDRVIQMWYEIFLDSVKKVEGKIKPVTDIKEDSLKPWQQGRCQRRGVSFEPPWETEMIALMDSLPCISFGNRKVEKYRPELDQVRDPNMPGTND